MLLMRAFAKKSSIFARTRRSPPRSRREYAKDQQERGRGARSAVPPAAPISTWRISLGAGGAHRVPEGDPARRQRGVAGGSPAGGGGQQSRRLLRQQHRRAAHGGGDLPQLRRSAGEEYQGPRAPPPPATQPRALPCPLARALQGLSWPRSASGGDLLTDPPPVDAGRARGVGGAQASCGGDREGASTAASLLPPATPTSGVAATDRSPAGIAKSRDI